MKTNRLFSMVAMLTLCLTSITLQTPAQQPVSQSTNPNETRLVWSDLQFTNLVAQARPNKQAPFFLTSERWHAIAAGAGSSITPLAAAPSLPVTGGGTLGRLTKWTGFTSSNSAIGDTTIYEDKFGKVGIGTDSPTSKLTVAGVIESTGGFKFPDGSVKTSAGVIHDETLTGDGTPASPLSALQSEALIEPIRKAVTFSIPSGEFFGGPTIYTVPAGKRLVIEHVSARCAMPLGQRVAFFDILTQPTAISTLGAISLVPVFVGDFPSESFFTASTPMKLYAHSGTAVEVFAGRRVTTGTALCSFALSGFLVDLP